MKKVLFLDIYICTNVHMCEGNVMMARLTRKDILYSISSLGKDDIVSNNHISSALVLLVCGLGCLFKLYLFRSIIIARSKGKIILLVVIILFLEFCSYI